jgi:hypothetical protein
MAIKIAMVKDPLRKGGGFIAHVVQRGKVDFDTLIGYMDRTTGLSANDIRSVFNQFKEALVFYLPDGAEVETPMGAFKLNMHARSADEDASSSPQDRKYSADDMKIQLRADRSLLESIRLKASVSVVDTPVLLAPTITYITNADTDGSVDSCSPGQILHIMGSRLSFDKSDQEQGVFLVSAASSVATRISIYSRIGTRIVNGKIPQLEAGTYGLEVRTRPTDKDIRVGSYDGLITIA